MRIRLLAACLTTLWLAHVHAAPPESLSLAGKWRFELDRQNSGLRENWAARKLAAEAQVPGSLPAQGIGDDVSLETKWTGGIQDPNWFRNAIYAPYTNKANFKFPFWLQPDKYYVGPAWFQRDIDVPAEWSGKRLVLLLERPHWETQVWLDGRQLGTNRSLSTPHEYELGTGVSPGTHQLTIRVDNSLVVDVGVNSHCVSDHTQGNWNGIVGDVRLRATAAVWIADLQVFPKLAEKSILVRGRIGNASGKAGADTMQFRVTEAKDQSMVRAEVPALQVKWQPDGGTFEFELPVMTCKPWDEFQPNVYRCTAELQQNKSTNTVTFGFRDLSTQGTQILVNGRKTFIRGTLECCIFPLTGHPPTDVDSWRRVITVAKAHGLNLLRFHSYCPPEAAFEAADELGFYYQVETCWPNGSTTLGDGKPVDQWVYDETERIVQTYGNHPSFLLMPHGNEPGGSRANAYLAKYVEHFKARDPRHLWTSGSGWPQLPENQFHVTPDPRIQAWGGGLKSRINAKAPETRTDYRDYISKRTVPVISHEIGQWCVYPNFEEIPKYKGYLKPKNFEIFRDTLNAHHMGDQAKDFLLTSGKLQTLCYKEDIESALRTPGMGGFELLDLHDFPGQGTALVGVLDPFWDSKGYVTPAEYSRFCNSTVPLARMSKRVFTTLEEFEADLEVAHFGPGPLQDQVMSWSIIDTADKTVAQGSTELKRVLVDNGIAAGRVTADLKNLPAPAKYKLVARLGPRAQTPGATAAGAVFENDWDFWVYPAELPQTDQGSITIADELDQKTIQALESGAKVLLAIPPGRVRGDSMGKVALGFSSIFWNTAWTGRQPPHTLGILCDPKHPALAQFPTEFHSNWQWWYLISRAGAMILDDLPAELRPIVQVVDDWVTNRRLGLIFEASVGKGKLVVSSIDLRTDSGENPVLRQMRHSVLSYMTSERFAPSTAVTVAQLQGLMSEPSVAQRLGARVIRADSAQTGYEAENALDGDSNSIWHTSWDPPVAPFPHELVIALSNRAAIAGMTLLPRQDGNRNGWIKEYEIYASDDLQHWADPIAKGTFSRDDKLKTVQFATPIQKRFFRLVARSGYGNGPFTSVAEIDFLSP